MGRRGRRALASVVALPLVVGLAGCGSSRTRIPDGLGTTVPGQPLLPPQPATTTSVPLPGEATLPPAGGPTTTSAFQTAGLKHTLASGATVVVSYPDNAARPPKDVPPAPDGAAYAVVTARLCAATTAPMGGDLVDPKRFSVEVAGQGVIPYDPAVPVVRGPALPAGTTIAAGACLEGTISFVIRGERHIESVRYDAGDGIYRWVS